MKKQPYRGEQKLKSIRHLTSRQAQRLNQVERQRKAPMATTGKDASSRRAYAKALSKPGYTTQSSSVGSNSKKSIHPTSTPYINTITKKKFEKTVSGKSNRDTALKSGAQDKKLNKGKDDRGEALRHSKLQLQISKSDSSVSTFDELSLRTNSTSDTAVTGVLELSGGMVELVTVEERGHETKDASTPPKKEKSQEKRQEAETALTPNRGLAIEQIVQLSSQELRTYKSEIRNILRQYNIDFVKQHGRQPNKSDKEPIRNLYELYHGVNTEIILRAQRNTKLTGQGETSSTMSISRHGMLQGEKKKTKSAALKSIASFFSATSAPDGAPRSTPTSRFRDLKPPKKESVNFQKVNFRSGSFPLTSNDGDVKIADEDELRATNSSSVQQKNVRADIAKPSPDQLSTNRITTSTSLTSSRNPVQLSKDGSQAKSGKKQSEVMVKPRLLQNFVKPFSRSGAKSKASIQSDKASIQSETDTMTTHQSTSSMKSALYCATVFKRTAKTKTGITLMSLNDKIYVAKVTEGGLFWGTPVEEGDEVLAINNRDGKTPKEMAKLIAESQGAVTVLVKRVMDSDNALSFESEDDESAGSKQDMMIGLSSTRPRKGIDVPTKDIEQSRSEVLFEVSTKEQPTQGTDSVESGSLLSKDDKRNIGGGSIWKAHDGASSKRERSLDQKRSINEKAREHVHEVIHQRKLRKKEKTKTRRRHPSCQINVRRASPASLSPYTDACDDFLLVEDCGCFWAEARDEEESLSSSLYPV